MSSTIGHRRVGYGSRLAVGFILLIFSFLIGSPQPAHAWKPKTHIYIANLIMADALDDGKVWIPPYGEFAVDPVALNVMRNNPDYFRAGAVGPDGFPDMFTGQMKIHTATDPWLIHLWRSAEKYAAGEVNTCPLLDPDNDTRNALGPRDANQAWSFVYGYLTHCGGDIWAHDWVNYYSGAVFPGLNEVKANPQASMMQIARHLATEGILDSKVQTANRRIAIPKDFVFRYMVQDKQAKQLGMNSVTEYFHDKYWQKSAHKGNTTWDGEWFYDLELGLVKWVGANETAIKQAVEPDQPKSLPKALADNLGPWAAIHVLDMLGLPSISRYIGEALVGFNAEVDAFWDSIGMTEEMRESLTINWSDCLLRASTGMGEKEWEARLNATTPDPMFFPNAAHRTEIMQEVGNIPAESDWVHSNTDHAKFQQFIANINGPLYNSVITGKLAVISKSELKRLDPFVARTRALNPLIGQFKAIDYSRQWQGLLDTGISGYEWEPQRYGPFHYVFKPYRPMDTNSNALWCETYTKKPTEAAWATKFPGKLSATITYPQGADTSAARLCVRKVSDTTGPWNILQTKGDFAITFLQKLGVQGDSYIVRPMHGRLNFDSTRISFTPPVDLFRNLSFQSIGTAPANMAITSDGKSDTDLTASVDDKPNPKRRGHAMKSKRTSSKPSAQSQTQESGSLLVGSLGIDSEELKNPYANSTWQNLDARNIYSAEAGVSIPVLDGNGKPTGQTVTVTPGSSSSSSSANQTSFKITGELWPSLTGDLAVEGNTMGMPSQMIVRLISCGIIKSNKGMTLGGCTGKLEVVGGDDCVTPAKPVSIDFILDRGGWAAFGARSVADLLANASSISQETVFKVGSHPGFIKLKATINVSPAVADVSRMFHVYNQVIWMINQVYPNTGRAAEWQTVQQILRDCYKYASDPANGEKTLRDAIVAVNDTTYNKNYVLKAFDEAVAVFPAKTGPGSECWKPQSFEAVFMVQPNITGPDSDAVSPSFAIGTPMAAGNTGNTGSTGSNNGGVTNPPKPPTLNPIKKPKTPAFGR